MKKVKVTYQHPGWVECTNEETTLTRTYVVQNGVYDDVGFRCAACNEPLLVVKSHVYKSKQQAER